MKKVIISLLILTTTLSVLAQKIPNTDLPFSEIKNDNLPYRPEHFPYKSFPAFDTTLWNDFQLMIPRYLRPYELQTQSIRRSFTPNNGNYSLKLVYFGAFNYNKRMLVTLTSNKTYIEALEAGVLSQNDKKRVYLKHFKIDTDMRVTVCQLKPTSKTPIMLHSKVAFPLHAQRIDTVYQIDSNGRFSQVSRTLYQPQNYSEDAFTNPDVNIWDGTETPI